MPKIEGNARNRARLSQTPDGFDLRLSGVVGDPLDGFDDDMIEEALAGVEGPGLVRINSPGGIVFAGIAIHARLSRIKDLTVRVEGLAASIASVIMLAGNRVEMERGSMVMIHNPWNVAMGDAAELRKSAEVLDKIKESILDIYERKTGQPRDILSEMMDQETWLTAEEAVEWGFADEVVGDSKPQDRLQGMDLSILASTEHAPDRIAALIKNSASCRTNRATEPETNLLEEEPVMTEEIKNAPAPKTPDPEIVRKAADEAVAAERHRVQRIKHLCAEHNLAESFRDRLIDDGVPLKEAEDQINRLVEYLKLAERTKEISGANNVEITRDETDTIRAGAVKAILNRYKPGAYKIEGDDPAREFAGLRLFEMARKFAERSGANVRGRSGMEVARAALHTTSDFPLILENVVNKSLREGYELAARAFTVVGRQATLTDYREKSIVQLGEAPMLEKVLEGGEYTFGTIGEAAEKYKLHKYGKILAITREVIVNDDLDAITRIPNRMGEAASRQESKIFWAEVTGNPLMHDGNALFSAAHGNLASASSVINVSSLGAARAAMRKQKGLNGEYFIDVQPRFLVVPADLETTAAEFVSTNLLANEPTKINPFAGTLQLVSVPWLDANSVTAWYLFADPNSIDTIEYAYLAGEEGPQIETREGFEVDGLQVKIRHHFGVKAVDWRGMYKNAGQ